MCVANYPLATHFFRGKLTLISSESTNQDTKTLNH